MTRQRIDEIRLSARAGSDLDSIWDYTAEVWSTEQANTYILGLQEKLTSLASNPWIERERNDVEPPVRLHHHQSHSIVYRIDGAKLDVLRITHKRQNWKALFRADER